MNFIICCYGGKSSGLCGWIVFLGRFFGHDLLNSFSGHEKSLSRKNKLFGHEKSLCEKQQLNCTQQKRIQAGFVFWATCLDKKNKTQKLYKVCAHVFSHRENVHVVLEYRKNFVFSQSFWTQKAKYVFCTQSLNTKSKIRFLHTTLEHKKQNTFFVQSARTQKSKNGFWAEFLNTKSKKLFLDTMLEHKNQKTVFDQNHWTKSKHCLEYVQCVLWTGFEVRENKPTPLPAHIPFNFNLIFFSFDLKF